MIRKSEWGMGALVLALLAGAVQAADAPATGPAADLKPGSEFRDCAACPPMIIVPPGRFLMGSPEGESGRVATEGPQHVVTIEKPFAVGKFEITFDDWEACVADRRCARLDDSGYGRGKRPVINVSYEDAG